VFNLVFLNKFLQKSTNSSSQPVSILFLILHVKGFAALYSQ